ncbi:hypothetical protein NW768_004889 [Fusarium equiseti]|uniref:Uncharacterized protein n=1 Tax=Fusarium equiseti TaxID=61235 RepID=A0ABQ8RHI0_FUSEQ|nr:hypothetical protein NW768_004889 [Fusarium equiseti]
MDRVRRSRGRDMSLYQHFDVLYVKDKFPLADNFLVHRLGKLISRRRQLLEYRVTHTQRLRPPVPHQMEPELNLLGIPEESNDGSYPGMTPHQDTKSTVLGTVSRDLSWNNLPSAITKATVQPAHAAITSLEALYPPSITESRTSSASEYTDNQKLHLPPRPLNEDGEPLIQFECPYCGIAKHIPIEPSWAWESHVLRDLQPYVCTFQECDMFDHIAKWSCNVCPSEANEDSPYLSFGTTEGFARHMTSVHKLAKAKLDGSMEAFRYPNSMVEGYCSLCKKYAQKLESHLGRHMEQMALFALPRPSLDDSGCSGSALANCSLSSSMHLSSDPGEESLSSPRMVHSPIQNIAVGSLGEAIRDRDPELEPPKTPDPSTDPHLEVEEMEEYNTGLPESVSNLFPSVALKLLEQISESLVAGSQNDSPPPPVSPSQQSQFLFVSKENAPKGKQGTIAATMPRGREKATQATVGNHGEASWSSSPVAENIAVHEESDTFSPEPNYQYRSLIRKFYSKKPPPISIGDYLSRLHRFCPMSSAVYLATSLHLQRLALEGIYDINRRNIYRLVLAGLRVSAKALEDLSYPHSKFAKVGGVSDSELSRLELAFCFLVGFDLSVTFDILQGHYEMLRDVMEGKATEGEVAEGEVTEGEVPAGQERAGLIWVNATKDNS